MEASFAQELKDIQLAQQQLDMRLNNIELHNQQQQFDKQQQTLMKQCEDLQKEKDKLRVSPFLFMCGRLGDTCSAVQGRDQFRGI